MALIDELKIKREDAIAEHERRREALGLREDEPYVDPDHEALLEDLNEQIAQLGG